jgi:RHS repeat-associated protein
VAQLLDYYPYGATRIATSTYPTNEKRQYIGQFSDAQTNLNYLNARYYSPTQGQFLSEDPVFWGTQNTYDPQSLNTYSYATNNPIIKKDPSGKCPWCLVAAAGFGAAGGISYQAYQNYSTTGTYFPGSPMDNVKTYGTSAAVGAATGLATAYAGTLAAFYELSGILTYGVVGGTAGISNFALTAGGNALTGQPTDYQQLAYDSGVDALTAGTLTLLPGVRGATPKGIRSALDIFNRAHAARWGAESAVSTSMSMFASGSYQLAIHPTMSTGVAASQLQSGMSSSAAQSVVRTSGIGNSGGGGFFGTYNFGSGVGTYNFGTNQWQK